MCHREEHSQLHLEDFASHRRLFPSDLDSGPESCKTSALQGEDMRVTVDLGADRQSRSPTEIHPGAIACTRRTARTVRRMPGSHEIPAASPDIYLAFRCGRRGHAQNVPHADSRAFALVLSLPSKHERLVLHRPSFRDCRASPTTGCAALP